MKTIYAADLFCGSGGTSTGLLQAAEAQGRAVELVAVNHWTTAVETHAKNHPGAQHHCADLDSLNPRKAVPGGYLDLLWASPECTHHSNARGGKPMNDQSRATAWCVLRWAEALQIETIMIENVTEFVSWGPTYPANYKVEKLRQRPIPEQKGEFFRLFIYNLKKLGYTVEWRELICANYGDATTRKRFFLMARKGKRRRIHWPQATHQPPAGAGTLDLDTGLKDWVPARDIIDWSLAGKSIFGRKKPLAENTIRRIMAGLEKFNGAQFVLGQQSCSAARSVGDPVPTIAGAGAISLTQPFLVVLRNNCDGRDLGRPLPAICTSPGHFAVAEPFLVPFYTERAGQKTRTCSLDEPLDTVCTKEHFGLAEPFLIDGEQVYLDIDFRMLHWRELARAHSFPDGYQFAGSRDDIVRMIGNSVPVGISRALCSAGLFGGAQ